MRISRKKRPKKPLIPRYKVNNKIKTEKVRLLDEDGEHIGVVDTKEALSRARDEELDLVEINPKGKPPVAQIMDFKHFKYQKEKEARKQKAKSRTGGIKGIRLSIRISDHDMGTRRRQAEKFLKRGDKVKVDVILKGAEKGKAHLAYELLKKFYNQLSENIDVKYEQKPHRQGHIVTGIIAKE